MANSYGKKFFEEFKYISDSRRRWREDAIGIINSGEFDKLQILTHAFWYNDNEESIKDTVTKYIRLGNVERYDEYSKNFTLLDEVIKKEEVL